MVPSGNAHRLEQCIQICFVAEYYRLVCSRGLPMFCWLWCWSVSAALVERPADFGWSVCFRGELASTAGASDYLVSTLSGNLLSRTGQFGIRRTSKYA